MNKFDSETEPLAQICLATLGASPANLPTDRTDNKKKPVVLSRYQLKSKLNNRLKLIKPSPSTGRVYNLFKNMIKYNLIIINQK